MAFLVFSIFGCWTFRIILSWVLVRLSLMSWYSICLDLLNIKFARCWWRLTSRVDKLSLLWRTLLDARMKGGPRIHLRARFCIRCNFDSKWFGYNCLSRIVLGKVMEIVILGGYSCLIHSELLYPITIAWGAFFYIHRARTHRSTIGLVHTCIHT